MKTTSILLISSVFLVMLFGCERQPASKQRAQPISCVNNLKQIGVGLRVWAGDHWDYYPYHLGTNQGGTMELCRRDADGLDYNSFLHFQVMSNEINSPRVLVCPKDPQKKLAMDFESLRAENVTYRLRTGVTNEPREILIACPIDGTILYADGTVQEKGKK